MPMAKNNIKLQQDKKTFYHWRTENKNLNSDLLSGINAA